MIKLQDCVTLDKGKGLGDVVYDQKLAVATVCRPLLHI